MWHVPDTKVHAVPTVVAPLLKVTVPAADEDVTVAVSVTLAPEANVDDAVGVVMTVVVAAGVAWALVMAASKNKNRKATLPEPFSMLVLVARVPLRVAAPDVVRISDIF
jgi:hypothetical protein